MGTLQTSRENRLRALHPATLATLLCGVAVSWLLFYFLQASEHASNEAAFDRRVEARVAAVAGSFGDAAEAVRATNLLFSSTRAVSDAQFADFAAPLAGAHPYIQALTVFRFVRDEERAAYEAQRRRVWPGFEIRERRGDGFARAAAQPLYLVLDKIVPYQSTTWPTATTSGPFRRTVRSSSVRWRAAPGPPAAWSPCSSRAAAMAS